MRIRAGQTLSEAKAVVPHIITYDDDPAADRRELESLAVRADCLSPIVHIEGDDSLIADVTGCERLFEGEPNLLRRTIEGFKAHSFTTRCAIADTLGAAWALAHAHPEPAVISAPGQTAAFVAPLPVSSLRIDEGTVGALASVGVETIESLLHLPRSSLACRFGQGLLARIDQALGDLPEVLTPYRPQPVVTSRFCIGVATTRIDVLTETIRHALIPFCEKLETRTAGVRQLFITFYCPDVVPADGPQTRNVTLSLNLSQPTRSVHHLFRLLVVLLDRLHLPAPTDSLMLWAREIEPLEGLQDELFATEEADGRELGNLLDRLTVRLGHDAVVRPHLIREHQPERAFRYVSVVGSKSKPAFSQEKVAISGPRPSRLSLHPIEIAATALVPEGPPISFSLHGTQSTVADSVGPERIETGWWRGRHVMRDYYRVTTGSGRRCWIFRDRDTGQWFLHGWFD